MISILQVIGKRRKLLLGLGLLALLGIASLVPARTPLIRDPQGGVVPDSVASLEQVTLGGTEQSILVRSRDKRNPILLFLHGGPGYPQIAYVRKYQQELENHFTVVNWDQRGSGKSYRWGMTEGDLQVDKLVQDTHELTNYLRKTFNQPKIFLAGHSWGSLLGIWTAQKYPDDYYAYIGIGQVANSPEGERLSYEFALREAEARSNEEAVQALRSIGSPPYANPRKDTTLERKWVTAFRGSERQIDSNADLIKGILFSPEYTLLDGIRLARGNALSLRAIRPQTENTNLFETVPELKVPVYLAMGRYDYMTPSEVAYRYYEKLLAPKKQFVWFEESAHFPHFEEADKFSRMMADIKEETRRPSP